VRNLGLKSFSLNLAWDTISQVDDCLIAKRITEETFPLVSMERDHWFESKLASWYLNSMGLIESYRPLLWPHQNRLSFFDMVILVIDKWSTFEKSLRIFLYSCNADQLRRAIPCYVNSKTVFQYLHWINRNYLTIIDHHLLFRNSEQFSYWLLFRQTFKLQLSSV
jgi:hypothetical protein